MVRINKIDVEHFVKTLNQNSLDSVRAEIKDNDVIVRMGPIIKDVFPFEDGFITRDFVLRAANKFKVPTYLFFQ